MFTEEVQRTSQAGQIAMRQLNRRTCLRAGAGTLLCNSLNFSKALIAAEFGAPSETQRADAAEIEAWMSNAKQRAPDGMLHVSRFKDAIWFLTKPIAWRPSPAQAADHAVVEVPIGFVTDFATIPRIFWSILPRDGEYTYAAIIHDFLYWSQSRPRSEADEIFKLAMEDFKIGTVTINVIYQAVRLGGQPAWDENAKLKSLGDERILAVPPSKAGNRKARTTGIELAWLWLRYNPTAI